MVAPLIETLSVLLAKVEGTYNVDPTPTGAADAILVSNLKLDWPTQVHDRKVVRNDLSPYAPIHGRKYGKISFDAELKGSGAAGTGPDWGVLIAACRCAVTNVPATSDTYKPISTVGTSVTIYAYYDGKLFVFTGCRGNWKVTLKVGEPGVLSFEFWGHCVDDQSIALATPTYDTTIPPVVAGSTFTINAYAGVIAALEFDLGNKLVIPDNLNATDGYGEVTIPSRDPRGSIDPEATLVATHDYWSEWEDGTQMALSIVVGTAAGNIATLTMPKVVYREYQLGNRDEILTYQLPFSAARNAGNDEVSLVMT